VNAKWQAVVIPVSSPSSGGSGSLEATHATAGTNLTTAQSYATSRCSWSRGCLRTTKNTVHVARAVETQPAHTATLSNGALFCVKLPKSLTEMTQRSKVYAIAARIVVAVVVSLPNFSSSQHGDKLNLGNGNAVTKPPECNGCITSRSSRDGSL
jgi:hypothetical protein